MEEEVRDQYNETKNRLDEYLEQLIKRNKLAIQDQQVEIKKALESRDNVRDLQHFQINSYRTFLYLTIGFSQFV